MQRVTDVESDVERRKLTRSVLRLTFHGDICLEMTEQCRALTRVAYREVRDFFLPFINDEYGSCLLRLQRRGKSKKEERDREEFSHIGD